MLSPGFQGTRFGLVSCLLQDPSYERGFFEWRICGIAAESWQVDGHFPGSKNTPVFLDLFLRDSHFGNVRSSLLTTRLVLTAINESN